MEKPKGILFMCYANEKRSRTAEDTFRRMVLERGKTIFPEPVNNADYEIISAGTNVYEDDETLRQVQADLCDRMDVIIAMDDSIKQELIEKYGQKPERIVSLNVMDVYRRNSPELVSILERELAKYF